MHMVEFSNVCETGMKWTRMMESEGQKESHMDRQVRPCQSVGWPSVCEGSECQMQTEMKYNVGQLQEGRAIVRHVCLSCG